MSLDSEILTSFPLLWRGNAAVDAPASSQYATLEHCQTHSNAGALKRCKNHLIIMTDKKILTGDQASEQFSKIMNSPNKQWRYFLSIGVFYDGVAEKYIAFDNSDGCCWTEEFDSKQQAMKWALKL